jgi:cellulose biosynthesis protein BcsQ
MLLGGMVAGELALATIHSQPNRPSIAGYIEDRISNPYTSPQSGAAYLTQVNTYNRSVPSNLYLVAGDERLETQASRVSNATRPGPQDAWRTVHLWIADLIADIEQSWGDEETCVFVDCNPSFSIYTELALTAAERLIIPFSADGACLRAVKAVLALVYGVRRNANDPQSEFFVQSQAYRMQLPLIYMYIGNRLTQANNSSASAFRTVVDAIGAEIWNVWQTQPNLFALHPTGTPTPGNRRTFKAMFQYEVNDANTASVVSGALGIPIAVLTAGPKNVNGRSSVVNQSQLDKQVPNLQALVSSIE